MPSEQKPNEEKSQLEIEKQRLECEKLRAEIAQTNLAWWKRPGYIGSLVPIVIAIAGLISAWATGFFDQERRELKTEISALTQRRERLQRVNKELAQTKQELQDEVDATYIRLKLASYNAQYTLGHIHGLSVAQPPELTPDTIASALADLPTGISDYLRSLHETQRMTNEIATETERDFTKLQSTIDAISVSDSLVELQTGYAPPGEPFLDPMGLHMPDGAVYGFDELRQMHDEQLLSLFRRSHKK